MRQPSPTTARLPTNTFCPSVQRAPIRARGMTWLKCQIFVAAPIAAGRSTTAVGCAQYLPLTRSRDGHRGATLAHRSLAGVQHAHHRQPLRAVAARALAGAYAVDEVVTLGREGLDMLAAAVDRSGRRQQLIHGQRPL